MESIPSEDSMKIVETTTKYLEYYINLVDKSAVVFERIDSSFERSSTVANILSNSIACYKATVHERKGPLIWQTLLLSYVMKLLQPPQPSATPP